MQLTFSLSWLSLEESQLQRFVLLVMRSRLPLSFTILFLAFVCADTVRQSATSVQAILQSINNFFFGYSMLQCVLVGRHPRLWVLMRELRSLVQAIKADPGEKPWVVHTRRTSVVLSAISTTYVVVFYVHMCQDTLFSEEPFVPLWPFVPYAGAWGALFGRLFYGACMLVWIPTSVCVIIALILSLAVPAGLHHALAQRLRVTDAPGRTLDVVQDVVAKHQRLRLVTHGLTRYFSAKLAHIQIASFLTTIFAFISVICGDVNFTTAIFLLPILNDFLQFSYLSQELSDSSASLARSAYHAATGGSVSLPEARALALVMMTASATPALRCRGVGRLSLATAGKAMSKLWKVISLLRDKL
ncbi:Odorant receptor 21 [Frankliniella occidentalis]|uniref:Uncharacterized protein LOC127751077 n=1 Tax=Frankliniella occidentalis TaxID=133901 RepID=A0A9C6X6K9_FRAOC|nr:uncharacterized protein LOC127751077 [Frankliniella occidentalis]KAE8739579.1 Odorant receptor 21 [Frankliniella occidentalis]